MLERIFHEKYLALIDYFVCNRRLALIIKMGLYCRKISTLGWVCGQKKKQNLTVSIRFSEAWYNSTHIQTPHQMAWSYLGGNLQNLRNFRFFGWKNCEFKKFKRSILDDTKWHDKDYIIIRDFCERREQATEMSTAYCLDTGSNWVI